jgi:hypothetical protein
MDPQQKFLQLLGDVIFKTGDVNSVDEFGELFRHNLRHYQLLEARGERFMERLMDQISLVLAGGLQTVVLADHGDTSDTSIRHAFDWYLEDPEAMAEWWKIKQFGMEIASEWGLRDDQMTALGDIIDKLPAIIIEAIVHFAGRLKTIPVKDTSEIVATLEYMMEEARTDDDLRNN